MPATTICFINQKGGCGKSSSCFHLAGHFAKAGANVLVIDADPQGSLSQGFFGSAAVECLDARETLAAMFEPDVFAQVESLATPTAVPRLCVIRANACLARHNVPQPELSGMNQFALATMLEGMTGLDIDALLTPSRTPSPPLIVLIDCPPNLYQCSWNALLASNFVVIPVPPEDFATQGLQAVHQAIEHAQAFNPDLLLLGHIIIRADNRLLIHRSYEQHLRKLYGETVFATVVPEASAFKIALSSRQPVSIHHPSSKAAKLIGSLADEILQRVALAGERRRIA